MKFGKKVLRITSKIQKTLPNAGQRAWCRSPEAIDRHWNYSKCVPCTTIFEFDHMFWFSSAIKSLKISIFAIMFCMSHQFWNIILGFDIIGEISFTDLNIQNPLHFQSLSLIFLKFLFQFKICWPTPDKWSKTGTSPYSATAFSLSMEPISE